MRLTHICTCIVTGLGLLLFHSEYLRLPRSLSFYIGYIWLLISLLVIVLGIILFCQLLREKGSLMEKVTALVAIITGAVGPVLILYAYFLGRSFRQL
jgi:hypothetical protein